MNPAAKSPSSQFEELLAQYRDQIAGIQKTVKYFLHLEAAGRLDDPGRVKLHRIAHKIAGSGGSYGFAALSDAGRDVERYAAEDADAEARARLCAALRVLIAEMDDLIAPAGPDPEDEGWSAEASYEDAPAAPPRAPSRAPSAPEAAMEPERPSRPRPAGRRRRILIVDDDSAISDVLRAHLEEDFDVSVLSEGQDAAGVIRRFSPDLVVLDNDLPGLSGLEILQRLQRQGGWLDAPVIMLTGTTEPDHAERALAAGAANYFTKPFDAAGFTDYVRYVLDQPGETVLLVDDDPGVFDLLAPSFDEHGVQLLYAATGLEALKLLDGPQPGLILLDRNMPGVGGGPVLVELRRGPRLRDIPVIMLSSDDAGDAALTWLRRGAMDFISKPFNPEEVALRALRTMEMRRSS